MKYQNLYWSFVVLAVVSYIFFHKIDFYSQLKVKEFLLILEHQKYVVTLLPLQAPFKTRKCVLKLLAMGLCGGTNTNLLNSCFAYHDISFISPTLCSFGWMFLYVPNAELANMIVLWRPRTKCKFIPMQTRIYC